MEQQWKPCAKEIFPRAILGNGTRPIGSLALPYIIGSKTRPRNTPRGQWRRNFAVNCGLCQKVQGACRWCNFRHDIRADITSRPNGNSEKYADGWNATARRRCRRGRTMGRISVDYISHDRGIRTGYLLIWRYCMVVNNEVQKCGTKQS